MAITVICGRVAREGQQEALAAGMQEVSGQRSRAVNPQVRMFLGLRNPRCVLYVGEWCSREEYAARSQDHCAALDALCSAPTRRWYCQRRHLYEIASTQAQAGSCTLFYAPAEAVAATIAHLTNTAGPVIRAQPGFVWRALYQDLDDPRRLLMLNGWRSLDDEAGYRAVVEELQGPLLARGVQIERFHGMTRAEIEPTYVRQEIGLASQARGSETDLPGQTRLRSGAMRY